MTISKRNLKEWEELKIPDNYFEKSASIFYFNKALENKCYRCIHESVCSILDDNVTSTNKLTEIINKCEFYICEDDIVIEKK